MLRETRVAFFLALRSLTRSNVRTTTLTISILSLIFINLIFLPALIAGIGDTFVQSTLQFVTGDVTIEPIGDAEYIKNADSIVKKVQSIPEVKGASARYAIGATFSQDNNFVSAQVLGINPEDESVVTRFDESLLKGEMINSNNRDEIVLGLQTIIGDETDDSFPTLKGAGVGGKISVSYRNGIIKEYKIKGIYSGGSFNSDQFALISKKEVESVLGVDDSASNIVIKSDGSITDEQLKEKVHSIGIKEEIRTAQEKIEGLVSEVISSFSILTLVSTIVSLVIAIVVLFMVVYINTINKKRQIGVLRAIGIEKNVIIVSYVFQSVFYTLAGVAIGGTVLVFLIGYIISNPIAFPPGPLVPIVNYTLVLQNLMGLIIAAVISGFIPSWIVTRQNIIDSIWR